MYDQNLAVLAIILVPLYAKVTDEEHNGGKEILRYGAYVVSGKAAFRFNIQVALRSDMTGAVSVYTKPRCTNSKLGTSSRNKEKVGIEE